MVVSSGKRSSFRPTKWRRLKATCHLMRRLCLPKNVARAEANLERLRKSHPALRTEIDAAVEAFKKGEFNEAKEALARIHALMAATTSRTQGRGGTLKVHLVNYLPPLRVFKSAPPHCEAALLSDYEI